MTDAGAGRSRPPTDDASVAVRRALGPGRALRPSEVPVQARAYGQDFGHVRIHEGAAAHAAAEALDANAFTWGRDVVLSAGAGQRTLAHELAHVVQQSGAMAGTLDVAPAGGALERDAELAAASGRPPRLRTAARHVQRDSPLMQVRLLPAERSTLDTYLGQHGFMPVGGQTAQFDGVNMSSAAIAQQAHDAVLKNTTMSLIKNDIDGRIVSAAVTTPLPPAPQYPKTTGQKIGDFLTPKPGGGEPGTPTTPPPSALPSRDDMNKVTSKPIPGDQSMFQKVGVPAPSQTPNIPTPSPGKASSLFRYDQLQARYAVGTAIAFGLSAPDGFWKRDSVKKGPTAIVLVPGEQGQPVASADFKRDGQTVTWPVPYITGEYHVMVTVNGVPEPGSSRKVVTFKPGEP